MTQDEHSRLLAEPIDTRHKALPPTREPVPLREIGEQGWNALAGDLPLPLMLLKESALAHNIELMSRFCRKHGVSLAPHGKTTMAPQLFWRQLEAGAWGITAATASQARTFRSFGIERVLLANELVEPAAVRWVAAELDADPAFEFLCLVDSLDAVACMEGALDGGGFGRPVRVLVELGLSGGRTGCRTIEDAQAVAAAVRESPVLELAGVEAYEGVIHGADLEESLRTVDGFLAETRKLALALARGGAFDRLDEIVVTAGGSAYFDRVVAQLTPEWGLDRPVRVIIRSGGYVTHDSGFYVGLSPFGERGPVETRLRPALEAWGVVLSRPEPELAIVGFGKRDVPYDLELPFPELVRERSGRLRRLDGELTVTALNDQHAFVRIEAGSELAVGDLVGCGISHPCTAFDKWTLIPVVDDDYGVVDAVRTFF